MRRKLTLIALLAACGAVWWFLLSLDRGGDSAADGETVVLRARVVDADGAPCGGVPVSFLVPVGAEDGKTADSTGVYETRVPFDAWPEGSEPWPDVPGSVDVSLPVDGVRSALMVARGPFPLVRLGEREYAAEIRLPPTGSLVCRFLDEDGSPLAGDHAATLVPWPRGTESGWRRTVDGRVEFPWVQPGAEFRVVMYPEGWPRETAFPSPDVLVTGPAEAGERREVEIPIRRSRPVITGILTDESGAPAADLEIDPRLLVAEGQVWAGFHGEVPATDGDGRFRIVLDAPPGPTHGAWFRIAYGARRDGRAVAFPLPAELVAGENEVGKHVLPVVTYPTLLAGRVVDEQGRPVADAAVSAAEPEEAAGYRLVWTDENGGFELDGTDADGSLHVEVEHDDFVRALPEPIAVGTKDARIVLRRGAVVSGSVELPPGTHRARFRVRVVNEGVPAKRAEKASIEKDGSFATRALPGRARVEFLLRDFPEAPVFVVDDVEVVEGEATTDSRLSDVDLAEHVATVTVFVGDPHGVPINFGDIAWRRSGSTGEWRENPVGGTGTRVFVIPDGKVDLTASAEGCARADVRGVSGEHRFALEPVPFRTLLVRLPEGVRLPPPSHRVTPRLTWLGREGRAAANQPSRDDVSTWVFGGGWIDGRERLRVCDPGHYRLQLFVGLSTGSRLDDRHGGTPVGEPVDVHVAPDAMTLTVEARVSQQQIDAAVR